MSTKERLLQEIDQASEPLLEEVLDFLLVRKEHFNTHDINQTDPVPKVTNRPIWEIFEDFADSLPDDVAAQLPEDGAAQLDHYLYGSPKRDV